MKEEQLKNVTILTSTMMILTTLQEEVNKETKDTIKELLIGLMDLQREYVRLVHVVREDDF